MGSVGEADRRHVRRARGMTVPVDSQIQAILDLLASMPGHRDLANSTPEQGRRAMRAMTAFRTPEMTAPVKSVEDITLPGPAGALGARVYRPDVTGPVPTVVFFHGGGWVLGDLETHDSQT